MACASERTTISGFVSRPRIADMFRLRCSGVWTSTMALLTTGGLRIGHGLAAGLPGEFVLSDPGEPVSFGQFDPGLFLATQPQQHLSLEEMQAGALLFERERGIDHLQGLGITL